LTKIGEALLIIKELKAVSKEMKAEFNREFK